MSKRQFREPWFFAIEKLPGVIATDEQMADILGGGDIEFKEE